MFVFCSVFSSYQSVSLFFFFTLISYSAWYLIIKTHANKPFTVVCKYINCSFLSPILSLFFLTRCVSSLDLPLCWPPWFIFHRHLKRAKHSPPPHLSSSSFSLSLSTDSHCWIVSACSECQEQWNENSAEGRNEAYMWNLHSFGVEPHSVSCPLVVTGGGGTSMSRCFYGYWGVDPLDDTLRDVNTPLGWGKVIKRADNFSLYELHYFHWLSGKKVKREQPPSPPFAASLPRHTPCFLILSFFFYVPAVFHRG